MQGVAGTAWTRDVEQLVRSSVEAVRYGTVVLTIQDGRVVQVDRNEKIRLGRPGNIDGGGI